MNNDRNEEAGQQPRPRWPRSFTHPDITRSFYGDGKVLTPQYTAKPGTTKVNPETGEVRQARFDPAASWYLEGEGNRVWGTKFALVSTRRDEGRFILGIEHIEKDEAKAALELLRRVKPHAPGAQAVVWDMILRGSHLQAILTSWVSSRWSRCTRNRTSKESKGRRAGTYIPKTTDLDSITVTLPDETKTVVQIAAYNGWASLKELTEATAGTATTSFRRPSAARRSACATTTIPRMIAAA